MREIWTLRLVALTGALVVTLAVAFACSQNPTESSAPAETASPAEPVTSAAGGASAEPAGDAVALGRQVYERERCSRCHSIAGVGSTRSPLDGVGSKLSEQQIVDWIIAPESLKDEMAPSAFRAKQAFAALPPAELNALAAYLRSIN